MGQDQVGNKLGIFDRPEGTIFARFIAGKLPVKGFAKAGLKLLLPGFLNGLDDRLGDRIPEPWQTHCEELTTLTAAALEDDVITPEEEDMLIQKCATIISERVNIPLLDEDTEAMAFLFLMQTLAATLKGVFTKDKEEE